MMPTPCKWEICLTDGTGSHFAIFNPHCLVQTIPEWVFDLLFCSITTGNGCRLVGQERLFWFGGVIGRWQIKGLVHVSLFIGGLLAHARWGPRCVYLPCLAICDIDFDSWGLGSMIYGSWGGAARHVVIFLGNHIHVAFIVVLLLLALSLGLWGTHIEMVLVFLVV